MANIIIPWSGTHAGIPAGWARHTALDGKFPKASGTGSAGDTGGSATHTHTSTAHTHSGIASHAHTMTLSGVSGNVQTGNSSLYPLKGTHTHSATSGSTSSVSVSSEAATYAAYSSNPPYHEIIFIEAEATVIPQDGLIMWNSASAPTDTDYKVTDGANSTINLGGKYLKSAAAAGDAGGTGGSTTNTHTLSHTHTTSHGHSFTSGGRSGGATGGYNSTGTTLTHYTHTHVVTLAAATPSTNSVSALGDQAETVEPAYHTLMAYQNKGTGDINVEVGAIAMTDSAELPTGWNLCDGTNSTPDLADKYIKISTNSGDLGNTGGSNTHTHASQGHTHTIAAHTHTGSTGGSSSKVNPSGSGSSDWVHGAHTHGVSSVSSVAADVTSANTTADSSNNEPEYVVVKYIQATEDIFAGGGVPMSLAFSSMGAGGAI